VCAGVDPTEHTSDTVLNGARYRATEAIELMRHVRMLLRTDCVFASLVGIRPVDANRGSCAIPAPERRAPSAVLVALVF